MGFQIESGACTGRGFAAIDANGFLAKFKTWVVKALAAGGPAWSIIYDQSATPADKTISGVDTGTDIITSVGHGFVTGDTVRYVTSGTAIGGLTNGNYYYVRRIDNDTFYLCASFHLAVNNPSSVINLTSAGTGTQTLTLEGPYIIIAESLPADENTIAKIMKVGYRTLEAGFVHVKMYMSWYDTDKILRGLWSGYRLTTLDAGDFAYDFRGGGECMALFSRISTSWTYAILDEWTGISGFVEDAAVIGTLQNAETAGASVVVELDTGEAALFTLDRYYYLYDFQNKNIVEYVKIIDIDLVADTVTIQTLTNNMSAGARIGAYPHRYFTDGNGYGGPSIPDINYSSTFGSQIPYYSSIVVGYVYNAGTLNNSPIYGDIDLNILGGLDKPAPDDNGLYGCMRPIITEATRANDLNSPGNATSMNRQYGKAKNIFYSYGSMAQMLDYRTINAVDYLKFNSSASINHLITHTESL